MNFQNSYLALVLFASAIGTKALACSYEINENAAKNDMAAAAMTEVDLSIEDVTNVTFSKFEWSEILSSLECPKGITFEATFTVSYRGVGHCIDEYKVVKVDTWGEITRPKYTIKQLATSCPQ